MKELRTHSKLRMVFILFQSYSETGVLVLWDLQLIQNAIIISKARVNSSPIMWRTVLFTFSLMISKFSALLPIRLCKMTSTHCSTGVTLTVSNSTQKKVKLSILEAMTSLHNFCLGSNTCHLSIRSKIWVLLCPTLYHGNLMLNQNFLNATEPSTSTNEVFPSFLCV